MSYVAKICGWWTVPIPPFMFFPQDHPAGPLWGQGFVVTWPWSFRSLERSSNWMEDFPLFMIDISRRYFQKMIWTPWEFFTLLMIPERSFFPRASERRVLPIVGVCISPSHLHTFSSSHLLIFTSAHLHIFSSSHLLIFISSLTSSLTSSLICSSFFISSLTSAHLHICSSSHLLSHLLTFTSSLLSLSFFSLSPSLSFSL